MTREEAISNMSHNEMIDTLKGLVFGTFDRTTVKEREALNMAINALHREQEQQFLDAGYKNSRDAISRILKRMWNCRGKHTTSIDKVKMEQIIRDELSVTRQTGEWILLDECANSGYYCSRCQKKLVKEGWSDTVKKIKFCPNCGAKMESEEKE